MIHRLFSPTLKSFKELTFRPGFNILLADKGPNSSDLNTRNSAGKTSMVDLVHFVLGADVRGKTVVRQSALAEHAFGLDLTVGGERLSVTRSCKKPAEILVEPASGAARKLSNSEWKEFLGERMFGLPTADASSPGNPTFRGLFGYFARREREGGFIEPARHLEDQQLGAQQIALSWLIGLDSHAVAEFEELRERERALRELTKAAKKGAFGDVIGTAAELKTRLTIAESKLERLNQTVSKFRVHEQYRTLEVEATDVSRRLQTLSNENLIDERLVRELEANLRVEVTPPPESLERLYREAQVTLPEIVHRRFEEVRAFHESVLRNRRAYLDSEISAARQRMVERRKEVDRLDQRRSEVMSVLESTGALEQFTELQRELSRQEAQVVAIKRQYTSAEQLEGNKVAFELERVRLQALLQREFLEQDEVLRRAILAFQDASGALLEDAGALSIEPTKNGPVFQIQIHGERSSGIGHMKIFCFDMMLMSLCAARGVGPGFLIHDSHIFDPVDERQVSHAFWVGAQKAREFGFQYIVTLNSDRMPRSYHPPFEPAEHILPVRLTDEHQTGGLFGFSFA